MEGKEKEKQGFNIFNQDRKARIRGINQGTETVRRRREICY